MRVTHSTVTVLILCAPNRRVSYHSQDGYSHSESLLLWTICLLLTSLYVSGFEEPFSRHFILPKPPPRSHFATPLEHDLIFLTVFFYHLLRFGSSRSGIYGRNLASLQIICFVFIKALEFRRRVGGVILPTVRLFIEQLSSNTTEALCCDLPICVVYTKEHAKFGCSEGLSIRMGCPELSDCDFENVICDYLCIAIRCKCIRSSTRAKAYHFPVDYLGHV